MNSNVKTIILDTAPLWYLVYAASTEAFSGYSLAEEVEYELFRQAFRCLTVNPETDAQAFINNENYIPGLLSHPLRELMLSNDEIEDLEELFLLVYATAAPWVLAHFPTRESREAAGQADMEFIWCYKTILLTFRR
jgi:hypothetical protein